MNNANVSGLFSAIRILLIALGAFLAQNGLGHTGAYFWIEASAGGVMVIGPAMWEVWAAISNIIQAHAVGAQAGINMTTQGMALAADGKTPIGINNGATPPKAVTLETGAQIVANFSTPLAK